MNQKGVPVMQKTKKSLTLRFTLFQILAFASFAGMNYYNVYLKSIGFDSVQIGLWGSISSIISVITLPVWGVISDKTRSTKLAWIISMVAFGVLYVLFPFVGKMSNGIGSFLPVYFLIIIYSIIKQPTHSLMDAWSMSVITPFDIKFAAIRKWGSFGFGVVSIIMGSFVVDNFGTEGVFYIAPAFVLMLCVSVLTFKEPGSEKEKKSEKKEKIKINPLKLFKNYYFATAFIMVIGLSVYSSLTSPFYAYILEHAGVSADKYGVISGFGAFVQIFSMLIVTTFCKKVPTPYILIAAGILGIAENVMYSIASNMTMMFIAGTLWGLGWAINVGVLPGYIHSLVPDEYSATAQTLSGTVTTLFSIIGNAIGGWLIGIIGISKYNLYVSFFQSALILLFIISLLIGKYVLKLKMTESE